MDLWLAYFKEALEEFERCLEVRKKSNVSLDIATTHRFIGETLYKMGHDLERSKRELDAYFSMTLRMNDFVEIQRAHTTLGNYFMALAEDNYKGLILSWWKLIFQIIDRVFIKITGWRI